MLKSKKPNPVVLVGIDAANWKVLDVLMRNGFCPNLSGLVNEGTVSKMMAGNVLLSPILWTSIGTGKLGHKHGIRNFIQTSFDVKCKMVWDILNENKISCGIFHWPISGPPKVKIRGFNIPMYSSSITTHPRNYSFLNKMLIGGGIKKSKGIAGKIRKNITIIKSAFKGLNYGLSPLDLLKWSSHSICGDLGISKSKRDKILRRTILKSQIFGKVLLHRLGLSKTDFVGFYIAETDHIQHWFWDDFFESLKKGSKSIEETAICKVFTIIDKQIGNLINLYGPEARYIVLSDHGMEKISDGSYTFKTKFILEMSNYSKFLDIWKEGGFMYVNVNEQYVGDSNELLEKFTKEIKSIKTKDHGYFLSVENNDLGGKTVFTKVNFSSSEIKNIEIFWKEKKYKISELLSFWAVGKSEEDIEAVHSPEGIFIAKGPGIKSNLDLRNNREIKDVDITPIILNLFGLPIADDFDGSLISELFVESNRKVYSVPTYDDFKEQTKDRGIESEPAAEVLENLRRLGYID